LPKSDSFKGESEDGVYMRRFQDAMHFFYKKHFKVSWFFSFHGYFLFSVLKKLQGKSRKRKIIKDKTYSENKDLTNAL
jgi:hypothetical protein